VFRLLATLAAVPALLAASASAQTGDLLGTLMIGHYDCELPGNAGGALRRPDPDASFTITSSSRYIAADGRLGTYLRTGRMVTMTSGPLAGTKLVIIRPAFLRRLGADGEASAMRCVLSRASDSG
jgi:hypothetical protein